MIVGKSAGPDGSINTGTRPQLSGVQRRQLIRSVHALWSGVVKAGEPLILDGLIEDVKKLSSTPAEMDFLGSGEWTKKRILQAFGTNPVIMGEELSNRASSLAAETHFAKFTVNPKIELISQCLTAWLGPMFAGGDNLVVQIEPYTPKDEDLEIRRMQLLGQLGAVTADELRKWAGLPALPHGLGQLPIPAPASVQDAMERMIDTQVMVTGRMIAQDVVDRQPEREARRAERAKQHASNGHVHA